MNDKRFSFSLILTSPSESQKIAISKYDLLSGEFFYMNGNNWNCDFGSLTLSTCPAKLKIVSIFVEKYSKSKKMVNILSYGELGKKDSTEGIH